MPEAISDTSGNWSSTPMVVFLARYNFRLVLYNDLRSRRIICVTSFLPRDAMLAWHLLSCLSVCPFVTRRYCIETTGRIELVLAFRLSYSVL